MTNAHAIQPWSAGAKPLTAGMAKIEQLLVLNSNQSLSKFLTAADAIRLGTEKNELLADKEKMGRMLEMSNQIRISSLVNFAVSSAFSGADRKR